MKYKVRFYREYEVEAVEPDHALREARKMYQADKKSGKRLHYTYSIHFNRAPAPGMVSVEKVFDGGGH